TGAQAVAPALGDFGLYPYVFGYLFTKKVVEKHGQAGLDSAFEHPPASSAQIVDEQRFWDNVPGASAQISAPPADGPVIDKGVIGQFGLFVMLRQTMGDDLALVA